MNGRRQQGPRILVFGEVLFDCFPDGRRVMGGAPFNVAWNLQALGVAPLLVSRVGEDELGQQILSSMKAWGMNLGGIERDPEHGTGAVEVRLRDGEPDFRIMPDRAYDFIEALDVPIDPGGFELAVHGTLALRHEQSRRSFDRLVRETRLPLFYDVNLRAPWWDRGRVEEYLHQAEIVKLNEDELDLLVPDLQNQEAGVRRLLEMGPDTVCLTLGENGAAVYSQEGCRAEIEPEDDVRVVDTVGAGDAFASVFILGRVHGWDIEITMRRAQEFAAAIVGQRGATVSDKKFYDPFREAWSLS